MGGHDERRLTGIGLDLARFTRPYTFRLVVRRRRLRRSGGNMGRCL